MKKISFFILLALFRTLSVKAQEDSIHKEVNLKEVRVEANNVNMHPDHTTYMPTQQQKNAANSGVNLLYNLMIPQLPACFNLLMSYTPLRLCRRRGNRARTP